MILRKQLHFRTGRYPYNISILEPDDSDDIMMGFEEEGDEVSEEELEEMAEYDDALAEEEY